MAAALVGVLGRSPSLPFVAAGAAVAVVASAASRNYSGTPASHCVVVDAVQEKTDPVARPDGIGAAGAGDGVGCPRWKWVVGWP